MPADLRSIQERCIELVDEYRTGKITYESAYVKLHEYIEDRGAVVEGIRNSFAHYKTMLDSHRGRLTGNRGAGDPTSQPAPTSNRTPDQHAAELGLGRERGANPRKKPKRRCLERSETFSSEEDSSSSEEECDRHGRVRDLGKRRRYLEQSTLGRDVPGGLFAFAEDAALAEAELPVTLRITRQRIAAYKQDEKASLEYILSMPGRPQLGDNLWKTVMLGQYLDLGKIHADSVPGKEDGASRIKDFLDWNDCWVRYAKAVTMVFPNRASELADYQQHITKLF
jgi:hypothetical protein